MRDSFVEGAQTSPAARRNREPILAILRRVMPADGTVLEIASGTGEHAAHFAAALPHLTWQPTDYDREALASVSAHRKSAQLPNLLPPLELDVCAPMWPVAHADAVVAINLLHVAPWSAAEGLVAGAQRLLAAGSARRLDRIQRFANRCIADRMDMDVEVLLRGAPEKQLHFLLFDIQLAVRLTGLAASVGIRLEHRRSLGRTPACPKPLLLWTSPRSEVRQAAGDQRGAPAVDRPGGEAQVRRD